MNGLYVLLRVGITLTHTPAPSVRIYQTVRIQSWSTKYLVDDEDEHNPQFVQAVRDEKRELLQTREMINCILTTIDDYLDPGHS